MGLANLSNTNSPAPMSSLPIDNVRAIARELNLSEIQYNPANNLIAFKGGPSRVKRINVWYSTGTVGTYIDHPRQGKTQLFRRNVDLALLREIFVHPRQHTGLGYKTRRGRSRSQCRSSRSLSSDFSIHSNYDAYRRTRSRGRSCSRSISRPRRGRPSSSHQSNIGTYNYVTAEEEAALEQKEQLQKEIEALQNEMNVVQGILDGFQVQRDEKRKKAEKKMRIKEERKQRGKEFYLYYDGEDEDWVYDQLGSKTLCVALGGDYTSGAVILDEGGVWCLTGGAPKKLHDLHDQRPDHSSPPKYVSLGSMGQYYFEVENGKSWWDGPKTMSGMINSEHRSIKTISFGATYNDFFIVWDDGDYSWKGSLPDELYHLLESRNHKRDLNCVTLGPKGEYFISCKNGRAWWGGMKKHALKEIAKVKDDVKFIDFGGNNTYVIRYTSS